MPPEVPAPTPLPRNIGAALWLPRIASVLATALLTTPLAGAFGGAVLFGALWMAQPEHATAILLLGFVFYGALFGSMLAWQVTLLAMPVLALAVHVWRPRLRWLLPPAGLIAGALRFRHEVPGALHDSWAGGPDLGQAVLLAGAAGGLIAGLVMAILPPVLAPRSFRARP